MHQFHLLLQRSACLFSPCLPVLCQSMILVFLCVHYSTSSINVLLVLPLAFFSLNFSSNSSKTFKPLKPLKICPTNASFCFTMLFIKCRLSYFIFLKYLSFLLRLPSWYSTLVYSTTEQRHQLYNIFITNCTYCVHHCLQSIQNV